MRIKLSGKFLPIAIAGVLLVGLVPAVAAYEAHLIDIKAHVKQLPPATRTYGFWKTHLDYTTHVFNDFLGSHIDIGWKDIYSVSDLMGVFYADVEKFSDNSTHRNDLCKERVKTSHQALAAILNSALPNPAPIPVSLLDIKSILSGTYIPDIHDLGIMLDDYNNSFDNLPILDGFPIGVATPTLAKAIANIPFADGNCDPAP